MNDRSFLSRLEDNYKLVVSLLLLLFTIICCTSVYNNSPVYDEKKHFLFGKKVIDGIAYHSLRQRMAITELNAIPISIINPKITSFPDSNSERLICRLPTIFFAAVLGYFVFLWSKRLYGVRGGILSLLMYILCPNIVAHSRFVSNDLYCSMFIFVSVFSFVIYLRDRTWYRLLIAASVMGMAQIAKQTSLLLFPLFILISIIYFLSQHSWREKIKISQLLCQLRGLAFHGISFLIIVIAIINLGYGFEGTGKSWKDGKQWLVSTGEMPNATEAKSSLQESLSEVPLPLPGAYVEALIIGNYFNKTGGGHGLIYLLGDRSTLGWWYYFPVVFMFKVPLPSILLFLVSFFAIFKNKRLKPDSDEVIIIITVLTIFTFFCFFCTAQLGIRYLLPIFPFLHVLCGQLIALQPVKFYRVWKYCFLVLLTWLTVSFFSFYPHFISYFNELCPNRLQLYTYLADSNLDWGQNGNYLKKYLELHQVKNFVVNPQAPTDGNIIVSVNNLVGVTSPPSKYAWLRRYSPVGHIAYSWLIYDLKSDPAQK